MPNIKSIFTLETRKLLFNRKNMGVAFLLLILLCVVFQDGIDKYKTIVNTVKESQQYEKEKVKKFSYFKQYGSYGLKMFLVPSLISIYFNNSSTISELTANVDSGERLNIFNSVKGRSLFIEKSGGFKDFSGIMLLFGSALALFLGYQAFLHKDYLRFMTGMADHQKLFAAIFLSRVVIINLFALVSFMITIIQLELNGINTGALPFPYLLIDLGMQILAWIFFFSLGTLASSIKSVFSGFKMIVVLWVILVFIWPAVINSYIYSKAKAIEGETVTRKTFDILMNFEKGVSKSNPNEPGNEIATLHKVEGYLKREYRKIQKLEEDLETRMNQVIGDYQALSQWVPSTFYLSSGNEISSKGYTNFIKFYRYIQAVKERFVKFFVLTLWKKKSYGTEEPVIESFFKDDEDIFRARPALPYHFLWGLCLTLIYITALTALSYNQFKKSLRF